MRFLSSSQHAELKVNFSREKVSVALLLWKNSKRFVSDKYGFFLQIADRPAPCSVIDDQDIKDVKIVSRSPSPSSWALLLLASCTCPNR